MLSLLTVLLFATSIASADGQVITTEEFGSSTIGLEFPNYGSARTNEANEIIGYRGINLGLGYSSKHYFEPLKAETFNPYWQWGTVGLILPYAGVGGDYVFAVDQEAGNFWTVGGSINLVTVIPAPQITLSYKF